MAVHSARGLNRVRTVSPAPLTTAANNPATIPKECAAGTAATMTSSSSIPYMCW
jgi:hypothetical protein